jgi:hypothetical protein
MLIWVRGKGQDVLTSQPISLRIVRRYAAHVDSVAKYLAKAEGHA